MAKPDVKRNNWHCSFKCSAGQCHSLRKYGSRGQGKFPKFAYSGNPQKARSTLQCNINVKANKCCFYFYVSCWTVLFDSVILASRQDNLRWLGWIFHGGYLPSLIVNCVGMSKDMGRRLPQLYKKKRKFYDLSFIATRVTMATKTRQQSKHSC